MKKIILLILLFVSFVFCNNSAFSQETNATQEPDFGPYMKNLQKEIKANWNPPKGNGSKHTVTLFKVNKNGTLQNIRVFKSSGDNDFDNSAMCAITKSAPFEPLPQSFTGSSIDIQFNHDYYVHGQSAYQPVSNNIMNISNYSQRTQDYLNYEKQIDTILSYNTAKLTYLKRKSLEIRLRIDKSGKIEALDLVKSSNNKKYDKLVLESIGKCLFPAFPKEIKDDSLILNYQIVSQILSAPASSVSKTDRLYTSNLLVMMSLLLMHAGHCCH